MISVANGSPLCSITGLPPCPVTAIAGVCPLFPSCPCPCSHRNCCLVLCLSASKYRMFGDDSEVEWNLKKLQTTKTERRGQSVRGRLFKSSPNLTSISGLILERRYKLSPSIILYFWLSWVSTEVRLLILMEFDCSVFRYPETNMHSNWCLRDKTIRQLVKGMIVKRVKIRLKDCE